MKVLSTAAHLGQAFKNVGRMSEMSGVFVRHGFLDLIHRLRLGRYLAARVSSENRFAALPVPQRLRLSFEQLGPAFVKLGQLLATRPDLIPESYVEEFQKLQDNVAPVPEAEIKAFLLQELKLPIEEVFSDFQWTPLAAASIAQVHAATLKTGERVAVKIQRPGIDKVLENDVSILRGISTLLERYIPESRPFNPRGIVEEFFHTILEELDFQIELNNIRKMANNLQNFSKVAIPVVYPQWSTSRVLVLERFDGIRLSDRESLLAHGSDPSEIVRVGSDVFFHMVMHDGLFHGDLHPGNLFVLPDNRIGIIDFGIVGRLPRKVQDSVLVMFTALVEEDYETLAVEYSELCQIQGKSDLFALQKDLMDTISPYVGMHLGEINVGKLLLRSTSIAVRHQLRVPRELMLLFKAMVTIEAMGKRLDPQFDMMDVGARLARQVLAARYSKDRIVRDLVVVGRDLHYLLETTPRLFRRFLKTWSQNGFALELKNPGAEALAKKLGQLTQALVACTLSILLGLAALVTYWKQDANTRFGVPFISLLLLTVASGVLIWQSWRLNKKF